MLSNRISRRFSPFAMRSWVRPIAVCLLLVHVFLSLGISIPVPKTKVTSERFPCENRPCGCFSAAHCWDKCCCHTDEEKLAWAEKNGVKPPDFLVKRVAKSRTKANPQLASLQRSCCQKQSCCQRRTCCQPQARCQCSRCCESSVATVKKCCAKGSTNKSQADNGRGQASATRFQFQIVMLDPSLRCKGIELAVTLFGDTWIPQKSLGTQPPCPVCIQWLLPINVSRKSIDLDIEGPVPRDSLAFS